MSRPPSPAVALVTFGCAKNLVDSEVMLGRLAERGFRFTGSADAADLIILNTCGFIGPSRREAETAIRRALAVKRRRGARVIVAGCYAQRYGAELRLRHPGVDAWLGVADYDKIADAATGREFRPGRRTYLYDHRAPRVLSTPPGWAYLKVSEGCSHECAFCAIPLIKGPYRSRPAASILEEARRLAGAGIQELNLISQDTTYYGRDRGRRDALAALLRDLAGIPGLAWIRILYAYPEEISDALLEAMAHPKVCRYLDIPFQHAHPAVLKAMKRSTDGARALRLVRRIRDRLPGAAVRTSLIVGFPGEGRAEFDALAAFVREAEFDHLGVFTYSPEDGTSARPLGDPVPEAVKERRRGRIMELQTGISARRLAAWRGRTIEVLIDGPAGRAARRLAGRARFQAPEVDGAVFVERPADWTPDSPRLRRVEIRKTDEYDLHGTMAG